MSSLTLFRGYVAWAGCIVLAMVTAGIAAELPGIRLEPLVRGVKEPTSLADDGSGRLFVTEQAGTIRIIQDGALLPQPFLDLRRKVQAGGECGLLCIAFAPDFATSGRFYLNYTARYPRLRTIVAEYQAAPGAQTADAATERILLSIPQPFANHNGGQIAFGKDGMLYIGMGDGGSANDPHKNGQNPASLLGKILRIDVRPRERYAIPPDNPFLRDLRFAPEVWALGLRNPWRFSFDRKTGEMIAADVGQNDWEEVDLIKAGGNYGWRAREGAHPNPNLKAHEEPITQDTDPLLEYPQRSYPSDAHGGRAQKDASITGGYVYRGGRYPSLEGWYFYGDYNSGRIWAARRGRPGTPLINGLVLETVTRPSSFGEDHQGELYLCDHTGGVIHRVVAAE